ncbi:carbohydrate esterase-like sialic acid-specific acetylesterase [Alteromonas sp. 76-1]|uniref:PKD domain-containing protein n=1 Tax=Alteromonas sp. 76-1 TaxID=2358187 RepID=UPI000FD17E55|nr:sialate O-acetylesterase [Alteromonas sp. 76-1]VEL97006.1 carbohydrate esterase-like sialic acid-specific acetylesterase [Alteromonas sp. 76-1]
MAILFDGAGHVGGFTAVLDGDFDVILPTITYTAGYTSVFGADDEGTFLQLRGTVTRLRFGNGGSTIDLATGALVGVTVSDGRIKRVGDQLTFTLAGVSQTITSTASLDIRNWGQHDGRSFFEGTMSGVATITGNLEGVITHDFDGGVVDETDMPNTSGDYDHGTLVGFTTGGYQTPATSDAVANAGDDLGGINAGDNVQLDGSNSQNVDSFTWVETTSTGVTLIDANTLTPSFEAPAFTDPTEIAFALTVDAANGTTDTDSVSYFVLEDGAAITDPIELVVMDAPGFPYDPPTLTGGAHIPMIINQAGTLERNVDGAGWVSAGAVTEGSHVDDFIGDVGAFTVEYRIAENPTTTVTTQEIVIGFGVDTWGHSNMSGRGASTSANYTPSSAGTKAYMFGNNGVFKELDDPYDSHSGQVYGVSSDSSAGGSLVIYMANVWLENNPDIPIYFVPNAKGSSGMETWLPTSTDRVNGYNLYEAAMARRAEIDVNICLIFIGGVDYSSTGDAYTNELAGFGVLSQANWDESGIKTVLITEPYYPTRTQGDAYVGQDAISQAINDAPRFHEHVAYVTETIYPVDISDGNGGDDVHATGGAARLDMGTRIGRSLVRGHSTSCLVKLEGLEPTDGVMNITLLDSSDNEVYNQPIIFHNGEASTAGLNLEQGEAVTGTVSDGANTYQVSGVVAGDVTEVVANVAPTANAGPNQSVAAGVTVQLDASSSTPGTNPIALYEWTQTAGDTVALEDETTATPSFSAPSKTNAQTITFSVVAIDSEGNRSAAAAVSIDVAAVVLSEILKIIERLDFELQTQGDVNAYYGRANREVMKLKPSNPEGLVMDGEFLNLESNTITEVKIVAEGVSISSKTDAININKSELIPRLGDLDIGKNGNIYFSIIVFVEGDDKGVVVSSKGATGNKPMIYVTL